MCGEAITIKNFVVDMIKVDLSFLISVISFSFISSFVHGLILQIVGRGNDQVAITTKFETRDDTCRLFKCSLLKVICVV